MSENRRSSELDGAARLVASARARLPAADLRLAELDRLTDWQRRTMLSLLDRLLGSVEDDLRSGLAARLPAEDYDSAHAALSSAQLEIARPLLGDASPWEPALVALLLRRAEEHRLQMGASDK